MLNEEGFTVFIRDVIDFVHFLPIADAADFVHVHFCGVPVSAGLFVGGFCSAISAESFVLGFCSVVLEKSLVRAWRFFDSNSLV